MVLNKRTHALRIKKELPSTHNRGTMMAETDVARIDHPVKRNNPFIPTEQFAVVQSLQEILVELKAIREDLKRR